MFNSEFESLIYLFNNYKKSLSSYVKKIQCRLKFHEKIYLDKKAIKISLFILKTKNTHKYDFLIGLPLKLNLLKYQFEVGNVFMVRMK